MNTFHEDQACAFLDYAGKNPERPLFKQFRKWSRSKFLSKADKRRIWRIVMRLKNGS